ncbi:phage tail protein [Sphingobium sp. 3R8]|uniref:phage tail protein n=1 Tax=Sphingobium sp. 3R8 TaxID=2874921 RepID=UPI001CD03D79|nr:phage tail protein [Sphingobium sp. 3R8]MBZ9649991.1 phage tail protein [Sphingobium sp. 3R8]
MKTLRTIAIVAGAIALVATGVGLAAGAFAPAMAGATTVAGVSTATIATVASVASVVSAAASIGAQLLQKKPGALGNVNSVTIGANSPVPCGLGRSFSPGTQLHDVGYGGKVGKTKNPYLSKVFVYSVSTAFAIEQILMDWNAINMAGNSALGYYNSWLYIDQQLGLRPEPTALAGPWGSMPDWSPAHKLSNYAAAMWSYRFDRDNKRWANGVPVHGVVGKWSKVYDWRQDDTFPGGAGSHRWASEDTFEYDPNVALNAVTYARGRYNTGVSTGIRMAGGGYGYDDIDWPAWTAFANVCDANGWEVNGFVYDGPGLSIWDNLKRICAAGAAIPVISGGLLSVRFQSPKVALDTVTPDDFADGERVAPGMRTWRDRINTMVPKYRSEANKWEYVQSAAISFESYITLDGEPKEEEYLCELVTDKDQAAQLTAYELFNRRELTGWTYPLKPRLWEYKLGEALHVIDPDNGVDHLCVIAAIDRDVARGVVTLTFETEATAKHALALTMTGTAPPPPTLAPPGAGDGIAWDGEITADLTGLTVDLTTRTVDET